MYKLQAQTEVCAPLLFQAPRAVRGLGCECGGALEEGSDSRESAARVRPPSGAFELCGDVLVGPAGRLGAMPRAAIRVSRSIGRA